MDIDEVKVAYPSMWELMEDLQDMGEGNAVIGRSVQNRYVEKFILVLIYWIDVAFSIAIH